MSFEKVNRNVKKNISYEINIFHMKINNLKILAKWAYCVHPLPPPAKCPPKEVLYENDIHPSFIHCNTLSNEKRIDKQKFSEIKFEKNQKNSCQTQYISYEMHNFSYENQELKKIIAKMEIL